MARQPINIGASANDGSGDDLRAGAQKINENFEEIYGWGDHGLAGYLTTAPVISVAGLTGTVSISALLSALGVEADATADQTGAEIIAAVDAVLGTGWQTAGGAVDSVAGETGVVTAAQIITAIDGAGRQIPTDAEFAAFLSDAAAFATAAQGTLADTATQPGDNISTLTNDAGFLTSAPVVSVAGLTGTVSSGALVTALGLDIGTDVQAYDANLPAWPATVSATEVGYLNGVTGPIQAQIDALVSGGGGDMLSTNSLSDVASVSAAQQNLDLEPGVDIQPYDANLPTWPVGVTATEVGFLDGLTSSIQAQIDGIGGGAVDSVAGQTGVVTAGQIAAAINADGSQIPTDAEFAAFLSDASAFATAAQGTLADSAVQPGANVSALTNDAGYLTSAPVDSVAGLTGAVGVSALQTALNVEDGATADQTGAEIKAAYEGQADTNAFDDAASAKLAGIASGAEVNTVDSVAGETGAITAPALLTALGVEAGATADQTGAEIVASIDAQLGGTTWQSGGGAGGDAWGDPVDADITFATNDTFAIGTDASRASQVHAERAFVGGIEIIQQAAPAGDALSFYDLSAGQEGYLTTLNGLTITDTTLAADVLSVAGETGVITAAALRTALNVEDGAQANPDEVVLMVVRNSGEDMVTGDGQQTFRVPATLNGMNLVGVVAYQTTAGVTGLTTYQVRNATQAVDMLSTPITIDSGETTSDTAAAAPVIDAANDDVATGDIIEIDIDTVATGTAPQGGRVELTFRAP